MANSKKSVNDYLYHFYQQLDGSSSPVDFLRQTLTWNQRENVQPSDVDQQLEKVDFDDDGKIDFKGKIVILECFAQSKKKFFLEFCYTLIESIMDPEYNSKLKILFEKYDSDNDGNISLEELNELIEDADEETWKSRDENRDGTIDYHGNNIANVRLYYFLPFVFSISEFLMVIFDVEAEFEKRS